MIDAIRAGTSFVTKHLAEEATDQTRNRPAIGDVAGGEAEGEQLAAVVDHQMEFESMEPAHRG